MITMIKRKSVFHPEDFEHTHELGIGSNTTSLLCVRERERARARVRLLAHISILLGLVKRLATFKSATCEHSRRSSLRKTGFVYLFCLRFFFHSFCQSVFFRLLFSLTLYDVVDFFHSFQNAMLQIVECNSNATQKMFHFSSFIRFANSQRS